MELMPILSTLRRHKTAAALIVVEIALTSAIVCNALHLIGTRLQQLTQASGLAEGELVLLGVRSTVGGGEVDDVTARDLQALKALPGVKSVVLTNQIVYGDSSTNSSVGLLPGQQQGRVVAANYRASPGFIATLGLKLSEGRDFKPEEYQSRNAFNQQLRPVVGQLIISQTIARSCA